MFDPHASYLPGASHQHPGLKIDIASNQLLDKFPDQFSPYLFFGCSLQQRFDGTLFRFPLRSSACAHASEIKQDPSTLADIRELLESFRTSALSTLLFLKNVRTIEVYTRTEVAEQQFA